MGMNGEMNPGVPVAYDPFAGGAITRVAPTTEPQREVWLATQLDREASLAFNESVALQLEGRLDRTALEAALHELLQRHDALRANFGRDGETLCVVATAALPFGYIDLADSTPDQRDATVAERKRMAVETPFDLERGCLFRAELLR